MATQLITSPNIIYAAIAFFLIFLCLYLRPSSNPKRKSPPEAAGALPIIGHYHLFIRGDELPHVKLAAMANRHGPIFTIRFGVQRIVVVSDWKLAKELFAAGNDIAIASRPNLVGIQHLSNKFSRYGFAPYGDYWREMRKMTTAELLSSRRVELLSHVCLSEVRESVMELHTLWNERKDGTGRALVDMKKWFIDLNLNVVMKMVVGKRFSGDEEEVRRCRTVLRDFFQLVVMFLPADALPWLRWFDFGGYEKWMKKTNKDMGDITSAWLEEHRRKRDSGGENKARDFMDVMIAAVEKSDFGGLFDADTVIKSTCEVVIFGGTDTVSTMLIWTLSLLLNHRHALIKVQQELDEHVGRERHVNESDIHKLVYLQAVIKETFRLYPAGPTGTQREFLEDCTIGGYHISKGSWLMINIWKIQRDPEVWPDSPSEFKPERFLTTHKGVDIKDVQDFTLIPFGVGRRMCPGMHLSLHEVHLVIANALQGFDFTTVSNEAVDMTESVGLTNLKATPLDVLVSPRLSSELY